MKRNPSQQGIALVITLIMLSVVTVTAIVFLAVSRRERSTVTVTTDLINARHMAEAGLARAQSDVVGQILSSSNRFHFDFTVSTNFVAPDGYVAGNRQLNVENANYFLPNGSPIRNSTDQAVNIGNLFYDPRPPVYIRDHCL